MNKILPILGLTVGGIAIASIAVPNSSAHQKLISNNNVAVMVHFDPNDLPYANKPSETWFMLMRNGGEMISPANCDCQVAVYDSQNRAIAKQLPLSTKPIEGHQKGHEAIRTAITFPMAGAYTVILTGQAKDQSFAPFELKVSVTVRP
ncbi:hypothetical protein [Leptolyngbya sp. NIES-2104]|uniref:hypothetical protein n=1 Tax=Leptolyngbya sp. NIES-2104 TaxID=1552121 RepID=UPI0006EC7284|nr:hypothetical protein [Leptolyngbya sp. NIES-2104]GAP95535.1 transketolase [Leptolyngbya sp. NIES-2104]